MRYGHTFRSGSSRTKILQGFLARTPIRRVSYTFISTQYIRLKILERNIPMLLRRVLVALGLQHFQRLDQLLARLSRLDDCIEIAALCRYVRVRKPVAKFFNLALTHFLPVGGLF